MHVSVVTLVHVIPHPLQVRLVNCDMMVQITNNMLTIVTLLKQNDAKQAHHAP